MDWQLLDRLECRYKLLRGVGSAPNSSILDDIDHLPKQAGSPRMKSTPRKALSGLEAKNAGFSRQAGHSLISFSRFQVRVVLCSCITLGHPEAVISGRGRGINILLILPLHRKYDDESVLPRTFRIQLSSFDSGWCSFFNSFVVWKSKDARSLGLTKGELLETMILNLSRLRCVQSQVPKIIVMATSGRKGCVGGRVGGVFRPVVPRGRGSVHGNVRQSSMLNDGEGDHEGEGDGDGGSVGDISRRLRDTVYVWWDVDNCKIPRNVKSISCNIARALRDMGYCGKISIFGYGNIEEVDQSRQIILNVDGVTFIDVPGGEDATVIKMIVDMMYWEMDNPRHSNYLVISGDTDFWPMMEILMAKGNTVMMASHIHRFSKQIRVATYWHWASLAAGGPPTQM